MELSRFKVALLFGEDYQNYRTRSTREANLLVKLAEVQEEFKVIATELDRVKKGQKREPRPIINPRLGDPMPVDKEQYTLYVAQVAGLHTDILKPKLTQMISSLYAMLEEATNDREYDQAVKGAIYFAWELMRWGDLMVNRQIAIQTGENPSLSEENSNST